ncbi:MAG: SDR family NAD(P)-dependent oxidoreductase [Crocinitomicaceae bacterium]|nr:SDR family NAD(P)-dependent oxidoreductase [Crocinitomicaceae bacterium]
MSKLIVITGVSSGIGYALTQLFLSKGEKVVGIGRRNSIQHANFQFIEKDLSKTTDFSFLTPFINDSKEILLINNAAIIGNLERVSEQTHTDVTEVMQINTIAPILLIQSIMYQFSLHLPLTILNISSGAARRPIPACASYCASKAALDMYAQTIYLEEKERGRNIKMYSVSPGVVDTDMQLKMRSVSSAKFSSADTYKTLKKNKELQNPEQIAEKIMCLLEKKYSGEIIYSLRDISI